MSNILSTSSSNKEEIKKLLKANGYQILGLDQREKATLSVNGKEHLSLLTIPFTVRKNKVDYIVVVKESDQPLDPQTPEIRRELIEGQAFFNLNDLLLVNAKSKEIQEIAIKFPREKGIDVFFQLLGALCIVALVAGIIWLMAYLKLY